MRGITLTLTMTVLLLASGLQAGPRNGEPGGERERPQGPPPEAVEACADVAEGEACSFQAPHGKVEGICRSVPEGVVACVPRGHRPGGGAPGEGQRGARR